jgi:arylsulfotransferase ASST
MRALLRAGLLLASLASVLQLCACGGATYPITATVQDVAAVTAAAANPVTVSPMPGNEDASPTTQISFLGEPGTRVADVRVVGSRSGIHGGVLRAYSTGTGDSFLPAHPFLPGEQVTVLARVVTANARTRGATTSFTIAHQVQVSQSEFPNKQGDPSAVQHYSSAPGLTPSAITTTTPAGPGSSPGDLFLAPYQGAGSPGPMIAEQNGSLVWFHRLPAGLQATNFRVQQYQGKPVLSWWQGRILQLGFGQGADEIDSTSYQHVATIRAGNGYRADLHEIRLTPQGTAWIDAFDPIQTTLSASGGTANVVLSDSVVQEIDVKTGLVMWEWHALGHIAPAESNNPAPSASYPWDYVHVNAVDPGPSGDLLLSARNTWTIYDVDIHSGAVRWRLGGNHSSFKMGRGTRFYWQHDAEFHPGGLISVFDNGSDPPKEKQSRGLVLKPDLAEHTVRLVKELVNPTKALLAESQGNTLSLPHGNWLLGYGGLPNITEFNAAGRVLLDSALGRDVQNFKTFLSPWSGQPTTRPSIVARASVAGAITLAVSWNGATQVATWRVLAGSSPSKLVTVAATPKRGFETTVTVKAPGPDVAVQALDPAGKVLGVSATVRV